MAMQEIGLRKLGTESQRSVWFSEEISHHVLFGGTIKEYQAFPVSQKGRSAFCFFFFLVISFVCLFFACYVCEESAYPGKMCISSR